MYSYKLKEVKENPLDSIVEKSGITAEFSINQLLEEGKRIEKKVTEIKGQLTIEEAKKTNVEENHPFVLEELSEEEIKKAHHITFHRQLKSNISQLNEYISRLENAIKENNEEIEKIKQDLDIRELNVEDLNAETKE